MPDQTVITLPPRGVDLDPGCGEQFGQGKLVARDENGKFFAVDDGSGRDSGLYAIEDRKMKLVSIQSDANIKQKEADQEVVRSLRELAANILRCAAGNGKGNLLELQCINFLRARQTQGDLYG